LELTSRRLALNQTARGIKTTQGSQRGVTRYGREPECGAGAFMCGLCLSTLPSTSFPPKGAPTLLTMSFKLVWACGAGRTGSCCASRARSVRACGRTWRLIPSRCFLAGRCYRGGGLPDSVVGFFQAGIKYRAPGFLATSFEKEASETRWRTNLFTLSPCNLSLHPSLLPCRPYLSSPHPFHCGLFAFVPLGKKRAGCGLEGAGCGVWGRGARPLSAAPA
jgi:hypothetical protein